GTSPDELAAAIARGLELATPAFGRSCRAYAEERLSWDGAFPAWEHALGVAFDLRTGLPAVSHGAERPTADLRSNP
ncbi:MAG TPA: hypothetical protein VJ986_10270, partial [Gaiellaceae bacterium]|nr:hypothetical protein [Gaiellaceae bacterium]